MYTTQQIKFDPNRYQCLQVHQCGNSPHLLLHTVTRTYCIISSMKRFIGELLLACKISRRLLYPKNVIQTFDSNLILVLSDFWTASIASILVRRKNHFVFIQFALCYNFTYHPIAVGAKDSTRQVLLIWLVRHFIKKLLAFFMQIIIGQKHFKVGNSVTRLGDLLDFG